MADLSKGFQNLERMVTVRNDYLNPTMKIVSEMEPKVEELKNDMAHAFNNIEIVPNTTKIKMSAPGAHKEIDLGPLIPTVPPAADQTIDVEDKNNLSYKKIGVIQFGDGLTLATSSVPGQKEKVIIRNPGPWVVKEGDKNQYPVKIFNFKGNTGALTVGGGEMTLTIPKDPVPTTGKIGAVENTVEKIELIGSTSGSLFDGTTLKIHLPDGSGGPVDPTLFNQNFKGFYESLGDLISAVGSDAVSGKSYAFVKDSKYGNLYYTPMFFVNGTWTELKQDPALLYQPVGQANSQGVFSIKPDPKITLDQNGQLDLSGLSTPPSEQARWFHGYFETMQDLNNEVRNPVAFKSFAYVKAPAPSTMVRGMIYKMDDQGVRNWYPLMPLATMALVTGSGAGMQAAPIYGVNNNSMVTLDSQGVLTVNPSPESQINATLVNSAGQEQTGKFNSMRFNRSNSMVVLDSAGKQLNFTHPQRVINYSSNFEQNHNTMEFEGNIFYDETSRTWMGWGIPNAAGAVDQKWTRIAHPKMSDEVKGLEKRVPQKAPTVEPGILGDNAQWEHTGWTYLDKGDAGLPEGIRSEGGYIQTYVKDVTGEVGIPKMRIQYCYADNSNGVTYFRRFNENAGDSDPSWHAWIRTSFSQVDINNHENNPAAHKNVIKYHKVTSFTGKFMEILSQSGGPSGTELGSIRGGNCDLIVDNYGTTEGLDYLEFPYTGKFRIRGEFFVSGYSANNFPVSKWTYILVRERGSAQNLLGQFEYSHTSNTTKYPPMFFILNDVDIEEGDKVYIKIKCPESAAINTQQPHLYFVPLKSQIVVEDMGTFAGTKIGETYKKHFANLNTFGDIEVKAHYNNFDDSRAVRVYGDKVVKVPTEMRKL